MSRRSKADVIVATHPNAPAVFNCVRSVLEHSGEHLHRLIVTVEPAIEPGLAEELERLAHRDARVCMLWGRSQSRPVDSWNRGLIERAGDSVLLSSDCTVSPGWLAELAAVAHSEERTACASPLTNGRGTCAVSELSRETNPDESEEMSVRAACSGLPRWTIAPVLAASCIYLRADVIDAVGLLDTSLESQGAAVDNWVTRAQALGFVAKRANHTYVRRSIPHAGTESAAPGDRDATVQGSRDAHLEHQLELFCKTLDGHLPGHAVRARTSGKLRVAYDIRHLPRDQVGTRTYAVSLGRALAELPEIELTLLVRDPVQARGLSGRVVVEERWLDDVEIIHKPAQLIDTQEIRLLFESSAHLVLTYQDLIGYRIPISFPSDSGFDQYRATSGLTLQAVQQILAISMSSAREIASEFGIPREGIAVVPHGVDAEWFARREDRDLAILRRMRLPGRFFFSLATDFPHKNLPNLLDAHAMLRNRWPDQEPPGLVLAGYTSSARSGFYRGLKSKPMPAGLTFLGPVSPDQLRVLYQNALALVFPSLYEGFGLPPLEAMAAGTPVIAMPVSAVPEVGGDCVLYPDGLSAVNLAKAMESLATDGNLRERLRTAGLKRVEQFRWEHTARATLEVYRSTVFQPSQRSLQMRRLLRDTIIRWSLPGSLSLSGGESGSPAGAVPPQSIGIQNAWRALNVAVHTRLRRELRRFERRLGRKSA